MLFDDGDYQSSETPAQKAKWRKKEKLWQAIRRAELGHPQVNDDEIPDATAEQARLQANGLPAHVARHPEPRVTRRSKTWQGGLPRWAGEQTG